MNVSGFSKKSPLCKNLLWLLFIPTSGHTAIFSTTSFNQSGFFISVLNSYTVLKFADEIDYRKYYVAIPLPHCVFDPLPLIISYGCVSS